MKPAYRIPDTPCGCVAPGTAPMRTVPITRMTVRSFIAVPASGTRVPVGRAVTLKGIAFDGGYGIREVQISYDNGATWRQAALGADLGRYSFREWSATWTPRRSGPARIMVRAERDRGVAGSRAPLESRRLPAQHHRACRPAGRIGDPECDAPSSPGCRCRARRLLGRRGRQDHPDAARQRLRHSQARTRRRNRPPAMRALPLDG